MDCIIATTSPMQQTSAVLSNPSVERVRDALARAGLGAMAYGRYLAFCVAGAVLWVGSLCTVGYFFGNIPAVKSNLTIVIIAIVLLSVSPGAIAWLRSRSAQREG